MTTEPADDPLVRYTDSSLARPIPRALLDARADVHAVVADLLTIPEAAVTRIWTWIGDSEEELRYGFYRIAETFERASIDAEAATRQAALERGRAADLIAPATAACWELQGLLIPLDEATWDADPGGGEWTIRQT